MGETIAVKTMVECPKCGQEMTTAESCTIETVEYLDGTVLEAIPYGQERRYPDVTGRCHDCGVSQSGYHHRGCDMEECPGCHEQLIGCDCDVLPA